MGNIDKQKATTALEFYKNKKNENVGMFVFPNETIICEVIDNDINTDNIHVSLNTHILSRKCYF